MRDSTNQIFHSVILYHVNKARKEARLKSLKWSEEIVEFVKADCEAMEVNDDMNHKLIHNFKSDELALACGTLYGCGWISEENIQTRLGDFLMDPDITHIGLAKSGFYWKVMFGMPKDKVRSCMVYRP